MVLRQSDLSYSRRQVSHIFGSNKDSSPASVSTCSSSSSSFLKRALSCATSSWKDSSVVGETSSSSPNKSNEASSPRSLSSLLPALAKSSISSDSEESMSTAMKEEEMKQDERVLELLDRLRDYLSDGLLSRQDYAHYRKLLKKYQSDYYIRQIHKNLDQIANASPKNGSSVIADQDASPGEDATHPAKQKSRHNRVSWEDQSGGEPSDEEEEGNGDQDKIILEPHDLWSGTNSFDEQQLQDLFVEMCFFARLGYVQPPCCLKCTYQETMQKQPSVNNNTFTPPHACTRWVVWRKDAATLLHPNRLDGNIMIVQCRVAKELLNNKIVAGRRWDAARKQVVSVD